MVEQIDIDMKSKHFHLTPSFLSICVRSEDVPPTILKADEVELVEAVGDPVHQWVFSLADFRQKNISEKY